MTIPFGSNYTHYAPNPDLGHQPGVVANYHQTQAASRVRDLCSGQLTAMRANGQTCISIPLYHKLSSDFAPDGFTLELTDAGGLDPQRFQNFTNLLADIKAAGFTWFEVRFLPAGVLLNDWEKEAVFIDGMRSFIRAVGLPYLIDVFGEGTGDFARNLWTWYTAAYFPGGLAVTDASISVAVSKTNVNNLPQIFSRNWPTEILLDVYGETDDQGWGSTYSTICGALAALEAGGVPKSIPVSINERWPFTNQMMTEEIARAMKDNPAWQLARQLQWPNVWGVNEGNNELASPTLGGILQ